MWYIENNSPVSTRMSIDLKKIYIYIINIIYVLPLKESIPVQLK